MNKSKPKVRIENWSHVNAFDRAKPFLAGNVYGHPRLEDGTYACTSSILIYDEENKLVETKNTIYILGKKKQ